MKRSNLLIAFLLIFIFSFQAVAGRKDTSQGEFKEKKKKLSAVEKKLAAEKKKVKKILKKETSVLAQINRINKNLVKKRRAIKKVRRSLRRLKKDIKSTESGIGKLEIRRQALLKGLGARLTAIYKMRNGRILNMAFAPGAGDSAKLARRHKYMTIITESDAALLGACDDNLKDLEAEKQRLEGLRAGLERLNRKLVARGKETEDLKSDKVALLVTVREEKEGRVRMVRELEKAAAELTVLLENLGRKQGISYSGFSAMRGRLTMPVKGRVISFFGKVRHPKFKTITFNKGIIINAPAGRPVHSVYRGRVIYTGWLKGYGQLMILDHGGGFYTLFAHLETILKARGEIVKKGEKVAIVGDTGPYATAGLYFEIRKKGIPQDPMKWLASK